MDFNDTQEEAKFRKEASEWLKTNFDKFDSERSATDKSSKSSAEPSKTPMDESKSLELAKKETCDPLPIVAVFLFTGLVT